MKLIFGITSRNNGVIKLNFPVLINQLRLRNINWNNETWVDSGGYQIIVHGLKINIEDVLKKYKNVNAYAFFSLDIPSIFSPINKLNFKYFEYLYTKIEWLEKIIPVLHFYPIREFDEALDFYKQYTYYFALGGFVASNKFKLFRFTIPYFFYLRRKVRYLHALGMSNPYFLQIFKDSDSLDTATYNIASAFNEIIWFDGTRRYVGKVSKRRNRIKLTDEEREKLFRFLDITHFPFEYNLQDVNILQMINAWILKFHNWNIRNKNVEYANYVKNLSVDSLTIEIIKVYRTANEQKKRVI